MDGCGGKATGVVDLYVAVDGVGERCTAGAPCSLRTARAHVRAARGSVGSDIVVHLGGGTYELDEPFALNPGDSGPSGHRVFYRAADGQSPVLSGGRRVTGWSLADAARGIYRAEVDAHLDSRQVYVNGVRATRARGPLNPPGFTKASSGYLTTNVAMSTWRNPTDIELVSIVRWRAIRCRIASFDPGGLITMQQPCWTNAHTPEQYPVGGVSWIENAYELLDEPGEWYLDRTERFLYYKPRADEDPNDSEVVVPTVESLVTVRGEIGRPVRRITLEGLTFVYTTWLGPNSNDGFAVLQAGFHLVGQPGAPTKCTPWCDVKRIPGAVSLEHAERIEVKRCRFLHLGGVGLDMSGGTRGVRIQGNLFRDTSATAIQVADVDDPSPSDPREYTEDTVLSNNLISEPGAQYPGGVGIFFGFTSGALVEHNVIEHTPYTGISLGWGWDKTRSSISRDNEISHNYLFDTMSTLEDGGAIYTLSVHRDSSIHHNFIERQTRGLSAAIHLDQGTRFFDVHHNVISDVQRWLMTWQHDTENNVVRNNFSDVAVARAGNDMRDNVIVEDGRWPDEAVEIMNAAGLQPGFDDLRFR